MTDSEIVKSLDICSHQSIMQGCDGCFYHGRDEENGLCIDFLMDVAFALINRQKAEIERLAEENKRFHDADYFAKTMTGLLYKEIRAEAIEEFAEKAKETADYLVELLFRDDIAQCKVEDCHKPDSISCGSEICIQENKKIWHKKIDNLVKEMVGE